MPYSDLRKGRYSESGREYFVTTVTHQRLPVFSDFFEARKLIQQLRIWQENYPVDIQAWVVMPDHIHLLLTLTGDMNLSELMKRFKGSSARTLSSEKTEGKLWQKGFYDHALRKEEDRKKVARYIVANPLRAGLVDKIGDYPYWDSVWL